MTDARDEKILHQADVEEVIEENVAENFEENLGDTSAQAAVTNLPAPSAAYVEAEQIAITNRINLLTQVMRDANLIPSA
jgi:hypothetical protein